MLLPDDAPDDGVVLCPGARDRGCTRRYCARCGDFAHPGRACAAPREARRARLLAKFGADTKPCPNCGEAITKVSPRAATARAR